MQELGRLLIVDDDHARFELKHDGERLGLAVEIMADPSAFEPMPERWKPSIIALDWSCRAASVICRIVSDENFLRHRFKPSRVAIFG